MAQHSIFISYRRADTAGEAGRVYDWLEREFGHGRVFKDVDSIPRGVPFREYVPTVIQKCQVCLTLIGTRWIDIADDAGQRRLDAPDDLVRVEIETAFATPGIQVIPVLIGGAVMPSAAQLPDTIRALAGLNAAQVRHDPDFKIDMARLMRDLQVGEQTGRVVVEAAPATTPAALAFAQIAHSLDPHDYADFISVFVGTMEAMTAARHKRRLEAWAGVDKTDPDAIALFLREPSFAELETQAKEAMQRAAEAKQRAFEQALAERRAREAAEAEARRQSEAAARKAEEERLAKPRRAAEAAKAARPVAERAFPIELPGVSSWPTPQMFAIPPGKFLMGAPANEEGSGDAERPQHEVRIDQAFALGQHTVTFSEWDAAIAAGAKLQKPGDQGWGRGNRPVINVSWEDAQAYLAWLNERAGLAGRPDAYRLPSEAEWEYACRARTTTPFSFGATISTAQANYNGNATYGGGKKGEYRQKTTPVGSFPASAFGLHDMHGNVWEWCQDCWNDTYNGAPNDGSAWTNGDCSLRVLRGGSWYYVPQYLRAASRGRNDPSDRGDGWGFRLARTLFTP